MSAQGLILWNNTSATLISVNGSTMLPYNPSSPATIYYFGLFIAPIGTPAPTGPGPWPGINDPNWQFVVAYTINSSAASGAGRMLNPGVATVPGYDAGSNVNFLVRYWQSTSGTTNWPAAKPGLTTLATSAVGAAVLGGGPFPIPQAFGVAAGQIGGFGGLCLSCFPPWFVVSPSNTSATLGSDATLYSQAMTYGGGLSYQWRKGGAFLPGAVNAFLTLTNVTLSDSGTYDVLATNFYGSAHSFAATLTVFLPVIPATLVSPAYTTNRQFQFSVVGTVGSNYVVQVATNLASPTTWLSLFTNVSPFTFVDSNAQNFPQRFYRAQAH
ncbi:MAG TPA: immunoglobulin domain-containing protein [Verrucomicrobiae bacterium]|nr:immunoglobulin domain-containing protein [Verrucomicrobiae bacterium]